MVANATAMSHAENKAQLLQKIKEQERQYEKTVSTLYADEGLSPAEKFKLKRKLVAISREKSRLMQQSAAANN